MSRAVMFPGQGSQAVGMGHDLAQAFASARELFEEVDDALGQHLSQLMWEGPIETLTLTENAQPALMAASMAVVRVLEKEGGWRIADKAAFVAGHSLGEYSALAAAGAFTVRDAARLLKIRGQAMQKAVPVGAGGMVALVGADLELARAIAALAAGDSVCQAANDNGGGQVVLSGSKEALDRAIVLAQEKGVKRALPLPVSAPFHSSLMQPAAKVMEAALAEVTINPPVVPVVANVTASAQTEPHEIRRLLVEQVTGTVRWRESVLFMKEAGVDSMVEMGAGKVLSGLVKRIDKGIDALSLQTPADVEAFLKG
ncbi:MAG: ACP S-malonyltransferase [Rhodospirillaceae bacterium]|nr:ACP S-malonyltransferase [Rhodospirillaceae bacterium]